MTSRASEIPHLKKVNGRWQCGDAKSLYEDWAIGFGDTREQAYDNWKRTQRYAHFQQRTQPSA